VEIQAHGFTTEIPAQQSRNQKNERNRRWTQSGIAATKLKSFAFSSRASRLRGESPAQDSPRSREERQEREDFAKKNPFLPAKDFRITSTDEQRSSSAFICGFVSTFFTRRQ